MFMLYLVSKGHEPTSLAQETEDQLSVTIAVKQDIMHAIVHNKEKLMHKQFEEPHQDPRAKDVWLP